MSACTYLSKLEALEALLDDVLVDSPADLPGAVQAEAQPVLAGIRNKHAAVDLRGAAAAFDASKEWMVNGSRSAAAWMAGENHENVYAAKRRVRLGRALRGMPLTDEALAVGEITDDHVSTMDRHLCSAVADRFIAEEATIIEWARTRRYVPFRRYMANWTAAADPDGAEERARQQREGARWHASRAFEDIVAVDGLLDPIGGSIYLTELQRLCDQLFKQDWPEAVERLGEGNVTKADVRTPAQRRAAAQVLMAERSAGSTGKGSPVKPVLNAVCDLKTLVAPLARLEGRNDVEFPSERTCRLEDGTLITLLQALSIGLAGELRRLLVGPDGVCLDCGQGQPGFTGDLRTAVVLTHEFFGHRAGCYAPSWLCEIDHIQPFADLGPTAVANGDPKCKPHNRYKETLDRKIRKIRGPTSNGDHPEVPPTRTLTPPTTQTPPEARRRPGRSGCSQEGPLGGLDDEGGLPERARRVLRRDVPGLIRRPRLQVEASLQRIGMTRFDLTQQRDGVGVVRTARSPRQCEATEHVAPGDGCVDGVGGDHVLVVGDLGHIEKRLRVD